MSNLGYSSQDDVDSDGGIDVHNIEAPRHFSLENTPSGPFTTAKATGKSSGADKIARLDKRMPETAANPPEDTNLLKQQTEPSVSTEPGGPPNSTNSIDRYEDGDEDESKNSIQNSSPNSTPPPTAEEYDRWLYHTKFKKFGNDLHEAAKAVFPNTTPAQYRNVYVLILKWEDEDPNLPVSWEIGRLLRVFRDVYHFETEVWDIKDKDCHAEVNQKILDFSRLGGNSEEDLKIVYYAGHGKLTMTRSLSWTR